jgi:uncharacterized protein YjbJ (UPF0337 family)
MGADEKFDYTKDRVEGRAKEAYGAATDDEELREEGRTQQSEGDLKSAGEKVRDAARKVGDAFKR